MRISVEFRMQDLWVGVHWGRRPHWIGGTDIYVCLIPCFPIHVVWS
jgi:hypothetical protein